MLQEFGTPEFWKQQAKKVDMKATFEDKIAKNFRNLFDVFKWWKKCGALAYPNLFIVSMILHSKPGHNGFQE